MRVCQRCDSSLQQYTPNYTVITILYTQNIYTGRHTAFVKDIHR